MIVAFVDTSVFIASAYSDTGASREIFRYAIRKELQVVVNQLVLEEVRRNLSSKRPEAGTFFEAIKKLIPLTMIDPTQAEATEMEAYTATKDAPHLASAKKAKVDYVVSLDRKHMVSIRSQIAIDRVRHGVAIENKTHHALWCRL